MKRHGQPVRTVEEQAEIDKTLAKFSKTSFGKDRKSLITALSSLSNEPTDLTNAITVCRSINQFLENDPAASPTEIIRKLQEWINTAKLDEGSFASSRVFSRKLMDIFHTYVGDMAKTMANEEIKALDKPLPGTQENLASVQGNISELQEKIRTLDSTISTLRLEKEALISTHQSEVSRINSEHKLASDRLNDQVKVLTTKVDSLEPQLQSKTKELAEQSSTINDQLRTIDRLNHTLSTLDLARDTLKEEVRKQQEKIELLNGENKKLTAESASLKAGSEATASLLKKLQEENAALTSRIHAIESQYKESQSATTGLTLEVERLKGQIASSNERSKIIEADLAQARLEASNFAQRVSEFSVINSRLTAENESRQTNLEETAKREAALATKLEQVQRELDELRKTEKNLAVQKGHVDGKLEATEKAKEESLAREGRLTHALAVQTDKLEKANSTVNQARLLVGNLVARSAETEDKRVELLNESVTEIDMSTDSIKDLGLERALVPRDPSKQTKRGQGQGTFFTTQPPAPTANKTKPPAGNGATNLPKLSEVPRDAALPVTKAWCLKNNAMSATRFDALVAIAQFTTKHLTAEKGGVIKANATQLEKTLFAALVKASKALVNNHDACPIEPVYQKLLELKPADGPLANDFSEMLTKLAVAEPNKENLAQPNIYYGLGFLYSNLNYIQELSTHFQGISLALKESKAANASTANASTLQSTTFNM